MSKNNLKIVWWLIFGLGAWILIGAHQHRFFQQIEQIATMIELPQVETVQQDSSSLWLSRKEIKQKMLASSGYQDFYSVVRSDLISQLTEKKFADFRRIPFSEADGLLTIDGSWKILFSGTTDEIDQLDQLLSEFLSWYSWFFSGDAVLIKNPKISADIEISPSQWEMFQDIFLFKSQKELNSLWYEVISSRHRKNDDEAYRRHNIKTAFAKLGNIRVVNMSWTLSFLWNIDLNNPKVRSYARWHWIFEDKVIPMYAGGVCGASTALYQWILTNKALEVVERKGHSKRYQHLYTSTINWVIVKTPGIDSAVYDDLLDLRIKNIWDYPVIIVMNYDGSFWWTETVFSLWKPKDKGSFSYLRKYVVGDYKCFLRSINNKETPSCYKEILQ